ncbi:MAG: permease [Candidatus Micrarchaeia archaeon]
MIEQIFFRALSGGILALWDYVTAHILGCLIPAFFIAGAMQALMPKERITALLGSKVPFYKAYPISVLSGLLLAVCSCTILPLFAGIRKKGAGLGPAIAFLYTAPATNILAIAFTGGVIGWDFALARITLSIMFAIIIGMILSAIFRNDEERMAKAGASPPISSGEKKSKLVGIRLVLFFASLLLILIFGTAKFESALGQELGAQVRIAGIVFTLLALLYEISAWLSADELMDWLLETWGFAKTIILLLLVGVFIAGMLGALLPENFLKTYVGENTIPANMLAVFFGVFMYFPTLVEVPMARAFLSLGMAKGPLLAYLLADPVISFPSILVVRRLIGTKQTLAYVSLIIIFTTVAGFIYGSFS